MNKNNLEIASLLLNKFPSKKPVGYDDGEYDGDEYGVTGYIIQNLAENELAKNRNEGEKISIIKILAGILNQAYSYNDLEVENMVNIEILDQLSYFLNDSDLNILIGNLNNDKVKKNLIILRKIHLDYKNRKSFFVRCFKKIKALLQ